MYITYQMTTSVIEAVSAVSLLSMQVFNAFVYCKAHSVYWPRC